MEARELRLKNLITTDFHGIGEISAIGDQTILYSRNYNSINIDLIKPIPLTEEWLLKFGIKDYEIILDNESIIEISIHNSSFWIGGELACISKHGFQGNNLKYVHQLQNLYFALTQKELILKT